MSLHDIMLHHTTVRCPSVYVYVFFPSMTHNMHPAPLSVSGLHGLKQQLPPREDPNRKINCTHGYTNIFKRRVNVLCDMMS